MQLAPGAMVTPNVRLVELLGTGGMGSVWIADHLGLQARVAVKFLSRELVAMEPKLKQRFQREASICARLRSVHVVQTFDHGTMDDGAPYIVMELLEGSTITQRVESEGPMTARHVAMMVAQIVKVLHRAHVVGVVHRDIKPDNLFITEDSDYELFVKVLDFGIAKQKRIGAAPVTATGVVVGTPEFMSPEQALSSKNADYRSDLFSLGVVAFYALTGELPYDHDAEEPLWVQMSTGKHRSARDYVPELPPAIDKWFEHALQPRPEDRFQSARTMADALAAIVQPEDAYQIVDELSSAGSPSWPHRPPRDTEEDSQPAMYELLGPDSEEFGSEATVLMDEAAHVAAEDSEPEPPTRRRPHWSPSPSSVRRALVAGVYNGGVDGAYNRVVAPTLVDEAMASEPPVRRDHELVATGPNWPTSVVSPRGRFPVMLAVLGALALATVMVVLAWWQLA